MAYDEELDARIAQVVLPWGAVRKTMFGGTGYLLNGHLAAGTHGDRMVLRLDDEQAAAALEQPSVRPFDMTTRPMRGWVMIDREALDDESLARWLALARAFAASLPPK